MIDDDLSDLDVQLSSRFVVELRGDRNVDAQELCDRIRRAFDEELDVRVEDKIDHDRRRYRGRGPL